MKKEAVIRKFKNPNDLNKELIKKEMSKHLTNIYQDFIKVTEEKIKDIKILKENSVALLEDIENIKCQQSKDFLYKKHIFLYDPEYILYYLPSTIIAKEEGWHDTILKDSYSTEEEATTYLKTLENMARIEKIAEPTIEEIDEKYKSLYLHEKLEEMRALADPSGHNNAPIKTTISDTDIKIKLYQYALSQLNHSKVLARESTYTDERKNFLRNQAQDIYDQQLNHALNSLQIYIEARTMLLEGLEPQNYSIFIPNQVMKSMTGKQQGILQEVRKNEDNIKELLKSLIKNNTSISREQKIEQLEQINSGDISFQMDCYLGVNFTIHEIVFIRAIEVIVSKMISAGEIENHFVPIYIPWHKIYEECGITPRPNGGYESKASKRIRDVLNEGRNLRKIILVKNEFEEEIMDTSFILERQLRTKKVIKYKVDNQTKTKPEVEEAQNIGVTLRLSGFLFFSPDYAAKLKKCTLMDNRGFRSFRQKNKTQVGLALFIWLERYLSQQDKTKRLDMNTIIVNLNLVKEYKKNSKRIKEDIERAFNDMIEQKTLITGFKKEIGVKGQEQYIFMNARYKPTPHKTNLKKSIVSTNRKFSLKKK